LHRHNGDADMELNQRSGLIHTLEALLGAILFLVLVVGVSQQVDTGVETGPDIAVRAENTLETLDLGGELRPPLANQSLEMVRRRVDDRLSGLSVEVTARYLNATASTVTTSGTYTDTFPVNASNAERQTLRLWFDSAAAPNVSVAGTYVTNNTVTVDGYEQYDISGVTQDGDNELQIDVAARSTVSYSVDIVEQYSTGVPPAETDVISVPYPVSGSNVSFQPVEVSVQVWQ
ncbi:MAG: hypothetical protein SVY41_02830, partial [Candidatus Nanohaloarchaea archaeon]|nr:hypothetical protein [Candidatus Nanohaloarchaea archaeon]